MMVDIYVKCKWKGALRGSGTAVALIVFEDRAKTIHKKIVKTEVKDSTKERLQLQAVTKAIHELKKPCSVGIYIDNDLMRNAITNGWPIEWKDNGWRTKKGTEVKNKDVWKLLEPMLDRHTVGIMGYIARFDPDIERELEKTGGKEDGR